MPNKPAKAATKKRATKPMRADALQKGINAQQERFCEEYVIDYHGTKAASRAGYSEKTAAVTASRLLKNAKVLARVRELQAEQAERLAISSDWVLLQLREVAMRAMVAEPVMAYNPDSKEMEPTGEWQFDSRGATKALELIGRNQGMFDDKLRLSGSLSHEMTGDFTLVIGGDEDDAENSP